MQTGERAGQMSGMVACVLMAASIVGQREQVFVPQLTGGPVVNADTNEPFGRPEFRFMQRLRGVPTMQVRGVAFRRKLDSQEPDAKRITGLRLAIGTLGGSRPDATGGRLDLEFDRNVVAPIEVFVGAIDVRGELPDEEHTVRIPLVRPYAFTRGSGELVLDLRREGDVAVPLELDAFTGTIGGSLGRGGVGGRMSGGHALRLDAVSAASRARRGGEVALELTGMLRSYASVLMVGGDDATWGGAALPFDLGALGATGNQLLVAPQAILPVATLRDGQWYAGRARVTIPDLEHLEGRIVRAQALVFDPRANAAGLVTSSMVQARIALETPQVDALVAEDAGAVVGMPLFSGAPGGLLVVLEGNDL